MSLASVGYREVEDIVSKWTTKYQYHIHMLESKPKDVRFMVEFSLVKPEKPIPVGTVRVYFYCKESDGISITFRFEKDSLIHAINKTIRHNEIEKWIDNSLAKKLLVRQSVFYLGTAYESTRVKDERQDKILKEEVVPEVKETVFIDEELLSDQKRVIEVMEGVGFDRSKVEEEVGKHFKQVDKSGLGVLTHVQFFALMRQIGLKLTLEEEKELLKKVDPRDTGLVEFRDYKGVAYEVFESIEANRLAVFKLQEDREEEIFGSILMLVNDEVQDIEETMLQKFKQKDENETGLTTIAITKTILEEINKKAKDNNKAEPLMAIELAEITKILTDRYGYQEIPYSKIHKHILDFKVQELAAGRIHSSVNKLEAHLRDLFAEFDDKNLGKVKMESFEQALKQSKQMRLTRAQMYLLKTLVPIDAKNEINYVDSSKLLAEIIKKFYIHSSKKADR